MGKSRLNNKNKNLKRHITKQKLDIPVERRVRRKKQMIGEIS